MPEQVYQTASPELMGTATTPPKREVVLYRLKDVYQHRLKVSRSKFYQIVKNGHLTILTVDGARRVRSDNVDEYIATRSAAPVSDRGSQ